VDDELTSEALSSTYLLSGVAATDVRLDFNDLVIIGLVVV